MKRFLVRFSMITAWIVGSGFTYSALAGDCPKNYIYWSMPLMLLGLAYFGLNIYWSQRRHNLSKMI